MNGDDENSVVNPSNFSSGFPTQAEEAEEADDGYPYPYKVEEPESVYHPFEKPEIPDAPRTREELEEAVPQYVKYVLKEYDLELEWERVTVAVDGRFTKALGKCGSIGYKEARIRISAKHYVERGYSWDRCKETIRHELAHAWQIRWMGYSSHGPTFRMKARELDCENIDRYDGKREPRYIAHCQNCGIYYSRQRKCRATKRPYTRCGECETAGYEIAEIDEDNVWIVWENSDWEKVL